MRQVFDIFVSREKRPFNIYDFLVATLLLVLVWMIGSLGRDMGTAFSPENVPQVDLDVWKLPYYAARSTLRMFIAYGFSFLFTLIVGYLAVHSQRARVVIIPAIDILQSVPVLGFLSVTITGFMALFPRSLLGVEMASLFAIFTGQVWNMTLGFYYALMSIPKDMKDVGSVFGMNAWQRFKTYELPSSAISLVWNSMMSFGGGWFFVVQSEAIQVLNQDIMLPGIGSYMAKAIAEKNSQASLYALITMILIVVITDQFVWRPIVVWSQKFRVELTDANQASGSWFLDFLKRSEFVRENFQKLAQFIMNLVDRLFDRVVDSFEKEVVRKPKGQRLIGVLTNFVVIAFFLLATHYSILLVRKINTGLTLDQVKQIIYLGFLTMLRVFTMVILATLVWTPIGVWIGFRPRVAAIAQPVALIASSFPMNMTIPFVVGFFVAYNVSMNWVGSVVLLALGTQWYILFNVIAGASAIPTDMRESARMFGLKGWKLWTKLLIPSIFPYWVTGACTAAGGAWNASIVAELVPWGNQVLKANGLGSFISEVTKSGDWPAIFCSILVMSSFVVLINRFVWRYLYRVSEQKFKMDV